MTKQRIVKVTNEQDEAVTSLTESTGETYADLVRRLLAAEAEKHGIAFPMNMPASNDNIRKAYESRWPKED